MTRTFDWDGEKIKETMTQEPTKHSTKDILVGLEKIRNDIQGMNNSIEQLNQQIETNKNNLKSATALEKELAVFEEGCIKIQMEKMDFIVVQIKDECEKKAGLDADKTIAADPDAYNDVQKENLAYLNYQKMLATNEKMAEKIAPGMIREHLYNKPIFDNPFKKPDMILTKD